MAHRTVLIKRCLSVLFVVSLLLALLPAAIRTAPAAAAGTTSVTVTRYASDGTTVLDTITVDYLWMQANLPAYGNGVTHYYHQGPAFIDNPDEDTEQMLRWNPDEDTNVEEKDMGAVMGTNIKDLCDLVGGAASGETIQIKASDGLTKTFAYENVYGYSSREGPVVLTWYTDFDFDPSTPGVYPDSGYSDGMRLVWFADDGVNPWGINAFGNYDWYLAAEPEYWYYYVSGGEQYPTTTGLSIKYVKYIMIYSNEPPPATPTPTPSPSPTSTGTLEPIPTPPAAPYVTSPGTGSQPGSTISTLTPTLRWRSVSGAEYYSVTVREYPYETWNAVYSNQVVYGISFEMPEGYLEDEKQFSWNVQAYNSAGYGETSSTLYFQISTSAPAPNPTSAPTPTPSPEPATTETPVPTPTPSPIPTVSFDFSLKNGGDTQSTQGYVSEEGVVQGDIEISSPDKRLTISIDDGTKITGADGGLVQSISASLIDPPQLPPSDRHIISTFDFEPDGAEFDPDITITISFNPANVPPGATLVLTYYDEAAGEWILVAGADNENGTATFTISHFSVYALMYEDESETESAQKNNSLSNNETIAIGIGGGLAALLVVALILSQLTGRRPAAEPAKKRGESSNRKSIKPRSKLVKRNQSDK